MPRLPVKVSHFLYVFPRECFFIETKTTIPEPCAQEACNQKPRPVRARGSIFLARVPIASRSYRDFLQRCREFPRSSINTIHEQFLAKTLTCLPKILHGRYNQATFEKTFTPATVISLIPLKFLQRPLNVIVRVPLKVFSLDIFFSLPSLLWVVSIPFFVGGAVFSFSAAFLHLLGVVLPFCCSTT